MVPQGLLFRVHECQPLHLQKVVSPTLVLASMVPGGLWVKLVLLMLYRALMATSSSCPHLLLQAQL